MARNYHRELAKKTPRMRNHFELIGASVPGFGDGQPLQISLKSVSLPKETTTPLELPYLNTTLKYAGKTEIDDFGAVFYDFLDMPTFQYLSEWRKQVFDQDTMQMGLASEYKKDDFILRLLGGKLNDDFIRSWKLIGLWLSTLDPGDADMDSAEEIQVNCTLVADRVERFEGWGIGT